MYFSWKWVLGSYEVQRKLLHKLLFNSTRRFGPLRGFLLAPAEGFGRGPPQEGLGLGKKKLFISILAQILVIFVDQ